MPQSILVRNIATHEKDFDRNISQSAKNRLWNKRFGIGHKVNYNRDKHALLYYSMFKTNSCDLIDYINKTIKGEEICIENNTCSVVRHIIERCVNCNPS